MTKGSSAASGSASLVAGDGQRQKPQQQQQPPAWPIEQEMNLFVAMRGHKPVGVDRHFQMLYITEKLNSAQRDRGLPPVSVRSVWTLLDGLYSMPALHDSEVLPFPNKEVEFSLPAESPDWKPVLAMEFPRVSSAAAAASAAGSPAASLGDASLPRKRGRPPARGTASPQAAPSSRSHSPAPSSDAGDSVAGSSAGGSLTKRARRAV